ncbi:low-specificity L-threonine aldolase [Sulfoacidibacillus thermotolerans]|uniref:Threonine aldolase n=1 Tax=Sulfoacidibacillus thermotolerans TaxID=1765684 RepID=A0A2U3D902_SULT2|nr:low-specificity L-threonine aldolase [Sulfoacidibacillus thermotolerans]PWI57747.1 threonine aldolase [Sulfoacidibacillus thermotolerans]
MIDLRSDTVTKPTYAMRQAMAVAEVGDDVYREDQTVIELEETAAEILGKEAGLFVTSGTQGNQVAILTHTKRGQEVIVEADSHVFYYEVGAMAALAGLQTRPIAGMHGMMPLDEIAKAIRPENIHFPQTGLICLENTHNRSGGTILPLSYMQSVKELAVQHHLPVHLDGARLFNAVAATGISAAAYAATADSIQICLSKGLGAPIGSVLVGSRTFIEQARKWRKMLGGGMRQAGVIAAPGLIALTQMRDRLVEDHVRAKHLAKGLANIRGITVDVERVETNIVIADVSDSGLSTEEFLTVLEQCGVLATAFGGSLIRFVTHLDVTDDQIDDAIAAVAFATRMR